MKTTYQYQLYPDTQQKRELNHWLRICRYWYNRQLGDRLDWWEMNRTAMNACPLITSISPPREKPNYYNQKALLPFIKRDLVKVFYRGELLDFKTVDSTVLQEVSKRVDRAFERFIVGDSQGGKSGRPRFKTEADYRTMTFATASNNWIKLVRQNWIYIRLPKLGVVKVRMHRTLPDGFTIKQASVTRKADGWFIQLMLEDPYSCTQLDVGVCHCSYTLSYFLFVGLRRRSRKISLGYQPRSRSPAFFCGYSLKTRPNRQTADK